MCLCLTVLFTDAHSYYVLNDIFRFIEPFSPEGEATVSAPPPLP